MSYLGEKSFDLAFTDVLQSCLGIRNDHFSSTSLEQLNCNLQCSNNLQCGSRQNAYCRFSARNAINTANIKVILKAFQEHL